MRDIARRQRQPDIDCLDRAVDVVEAKPQSARADVVAGEHVDERRHEAIGMGDDRVMGEDRLDEITQRVIDRRRDDRHQRLVDAAERLVDAAQELGWKARGEWRARLVEQRADGLEAEPAQRRAGLRRKPQRCDGQRRERRGFLAAGQNERRRLVKARQRPGRARRVGDGKPRRQREIFSQSCSKIGEQLFLAAEQMRRAGDIEEKTVGAIGFVPRRGSRRVARRPQRQAPQRGIVGGGIGVAHLQKFRFGPGVGQQVAGREAGGLRRRVQGGDARAACRNDSEDERTVRINWLA